MDALHFAFHELFDGYRLRGSVAEGSGGKRQDARTLSIFFVLNTVCRILKFAMNSYSCLAIIFTRCMGMSPVRAMPGERERENANQTPIAGDIEGIAHHIRSR